MNSYQISEFSIISRAKFKATSLQSVTIILSTLSYPSAEISVINFLPTSFISVIVAGYFIILRGPPLQRFIPVTLLFIQVL